MAGGLGDDTYVVDVDADVVTEALNAGTDTVVTSLNYTLGENVENLTLTGSCDQRHRQRSQQRTDRVILWRTSLTAGPGSDTMVGGGGSDTYIVDNVGDVIVEKSPNFGIDLAQSSVSYVLPENVENLTLIGGANINGTGK